MQCGGRLLRKVVGFHYCFLSLEQSRFETTLRLVAAAAAQPSASSLLGSGGDETATTHVAAETISCVLRAIVAAAVSVRDSSFRAIPLPCTKLSAMRRWLLRLAAMHIHLCLLQPYGHR